MRAVSLELLDCGFLDKGGAVLVDLTLLLRRLHGHALNSAAATAAAAAAAAAAEEAAAKATVTDTSTTQDESGTTAAAASVQAASATVATVEMLLKEAQVAQWSSNGHLWCGEYSISREASLRRVRNLLVEFHPACQPASRCTGWRSLPCEGISGSTTSGETKSSMEASPAHAWAQAALGEGGAEWVDHVANARLEVGRKAPALALRKALSQNNATMVPAEAKSENDDTDSNVPLIDSLEMLVGLQEAAAMATQVMDVVGPLPFLVLAVATAHLNNETTQDQPGTAAEAIQTTAPESGAAAPAAATAARANAAAWSLAWPDLWASLWRAALLTLLEGCQRVAGTPVARLLAQTNHGQLVCLSAGKGADARAVSAQAALLLGLVQRPISTSGSDEGTPANTPGSGAAVFQGEDEDSEAIDAAALVTACKLVRINFGSSTLSARTPLPRGVELLQGDPLPQIEGLHLCPDFYAGTIASVSTIAHIPRNHLSTHGSNGPPTRHNLSLSLFASCGAAAPAAKLMGSLGYAHLPSSGQSLELSLLNGGGMKSNPAIGGGGSSSGGIPNLACFQAEQGRLFPECIPACCAGEQSALQLAEAALATSHHHHHMMDSSITSSSTYSSAATGAGAHSWHLHSRPSGLTALQERRLHQRGLDPLGLADVLAALPDEHNEDNNRHEHQSEAPEVKIAVEMGGNLKPSWARSVESELLEAFQSTATKNKSTKSMGRAKTRAATTTKAVTAQRSNHTTSSPTLVPHQAGTKENQRQQRQQQKQRVVSWNDNGVDKVKAQAPHSMMQGSLDNSSSSLADPPSSSLTHALPPPPSSQKKDAAKVAGCSSGISTEESADILPASPPLPPPTPQNDPSLALPLRRHIRLLASGGAIADVEFWSAAEHSLDDVDEGDDDDGDETSNASCGTAAGRKRSEEPYRITIDPSRDGLAGVAWQALAHHRLVRWLEGGLTSNKTKSSSNSTAKSSSSAVHASDDVLAPLPLHLCVGPRGMAALVQAQQRAQGRLRLRTVLLGNRASRAHCVAEAWQLRCSALEASVAEITEESARTQRRLERQLRVAQRQHDAEREAASQKWHRAQAESAQRLASAKEALRVAEGSIGDAVLQERRRVTQCVQILLFD